MTAGPGGAARPETDAPKDDAAAARVACDAAPLPVQARGDAPGDAPGDAAPANGADDQDHEHEADDAAAAAAPRVRDPDVAAARARGLRLTPDEIRRAIVIDFEGGGRRPDGMEPPPSYLGVLIEKRYECLALDPPPKRDLLARAERGMACFVRRQGLADAMAEIARCAETESRVVIFFSRHELNVLRTHLDAALYERVRPHLADAKRLLERGRRERKDIPPSDALADLAEPWARALLEQQRKPRGGVGKCIARIARGLKGRRRVRNVRDRVWRDLDDLVTYNRLDCKITRRAARKAARLLAAKRRGSAGDGASASAPADGPPAPSEAG